MRTKNVSLTLAAAGAAAFLTLAQPASAQVTNPGFPSTYSSYSAHYETGTGGGVDTLGSNGGQQIRTVDGKPSIRPLPAQADWSTSLEYEGWSGAGIRYFSGHRTTVIAGYNRGLSEKSEIGLTIPLEQVFVNNVIDKSGVGDVELAYRHYFFDAKTENSPTVALSGRLFLPTGDRKNAIGLGTWAYGGSLNAVQPMGPRSSAYCGVGYNALSDEDGINFRNVFYYWAGGLSTLTPKWNLQYEACRFNSPANEGYSRVLVGARYAMTPSVGLQVNVKREFQADGHPTTLSVGYSARM